MIRAGLIGCGRVGGIHTEKLEQIDGVEMVAFSDVVEERAEEYATEYGGEYATSEPDELLDDASIDAVYVCTRTDTHAEYAIRSVESGTHAMVEKPLALSSEDCIAVYDAVEANDVTLMTGFKMRYYDLIRKANALIPDPHVVTMQMMDDRLPDDIWVNDPEQGGGNVISQGVHSADLLRYLAGSEPIAVSAEGGNYYQQTGVIDNMTAVYRFEDGTAGNLVQGDANCPSHTSKLFLQLFDGNQSVTVTDRFCTLVYEDSDGKQVFEGEESGYLKENRAFRDALQSNDSAPVDHLDGYLSTEMILRGFDSIRSGETEPIRLPGT